MKLTKKDISAKDGSGTVGLKPETPEDLWHAYNLLQTGDLVRCTTIRKVMKETSTGSTSSNKMRMMLTIEVKKVDFDVDSLQLRLSGTNQSENEHVRMGAHHTITLELGRAFSIEKVCWDQVFLDIIEEACHPERGAEIAAVVMQPGLAHLCMVTGSLTITKAKIEITIPKKRTGSTNHQKAINRFFGALYRAILQHIDFDKVKCILLASPGYVKDDFYKYVQAESARRDDRPYIENKSKFVLCKASSGHKHALEEVFSDPDIMSQITETKVAKEVGVLNKFMRMIYICPEKAFYGFKHVSKANEELAIESLMVTDELFRSSDIKTRKSYVSLVESVRENGGQVYILSSMHESGKQLQQVSGVAAILRYPLPDLDEESEDEESDSDESDHEKTEAELHAEPLADDLQNMGF